MSRTYDGFPSYIPIWGHIRHAEFWAKPQNPKLVNPKQFWAKLLDPKPQNSIFGKKLQFLIAKSEF